MDCEADWGTGELSSYTSPIEKKYEFNISIYRDMSKYKDRLSYKALGGK